MAHSTKLRGSFREGVFLHAFALLSLWLLIQKGNAYEFKVGGAGNWVVPSDTNSNNYNQWAEKSRFQIGDTLLFVYDAGKDSVLYVTKEDYDGCKTESPLEKYTDGHTVFQFSHSGPHFFISGVKENCQKNEKLHVVVLADRSNRSSGNQTVSSPPPAPSAAAPAGQEAPPPPPTGSVEINPAPAPSEEEDHPPPNGASSVAMSVIASIGAFIGSTILLLP